VSPGTLGGATVSDDRWAALRTTFAGFAGPYEDNIYNAARDLLAERDRLAAIASPTAGAYACQACGRMDGLDAVVSDGVWAQINGGQNLLCLWCIDGRCAERGFAVSCSLHFAGKAVHGTSQSEADQEHIGRLAAENAALAKERDDLRKAFVRFIGQLATARLRNTPEWMALIVENVNDALKAVGDDDRVELSRWRDSLRIVRAAEL
jgi:hypothetical protein